MRREERLTTLPLIAALIGLAGSLLTTFLIYAAARHAIDQFPGDPQFVQSIEVRLSQAWIFAGLIMILTAISIGLMAGRWRRAERIRSRAQTAQARAVWMGEMSAMAAHEIRNPLGVIRGTVELMRERLGDGLDADSRKALSDILGEVDRLRRLTDDFVDLARERPLSQAPAKLGMIVDEAQRVTLANHPSVRIVQDVPEDLRMNVDSRRITQVLTNLMSNAAQAHEGGEIRVRVKRDGPEVIMQVEDDGPGVEPTARDRLFEPYFTTKATGTGLGLALAKRMVEGHGGSIKLLDGKRQQGACFEVRLPIRGEV